LDYFALPGTVSAMYKLLQVRGYVKEIPQAETLFMMIGAGILAYCYEHKKNFVNAQT